MKMKIEAWSSKALLAPTVGVFWPQSKWKMCGKYLAVVIVVRVVAVGDDVERGAAGVLVNC